MCTLPALLHQPLQFPQLDSILYCALVQTYVHWGLHEPNPGEFSWEGEANLHSYLATASDLGLNVVLRPGPYICAEVSFGGLPYWLGSSQVPNKLTHPLAVGRAAGLLLQD